MTPRRKKSPDGLSIRDRRYLESIAKYIEDGLTPEQVAIQFDLDLTEVKKYINLPIFVTFLSEDKREEWQSYREGEKARESLRNMARKNLDRYFEELDKMALDPNVRDDIRRDCLKECIRLSGAAAEATADTEVVEIPPNQLAAIERATQAMDSQERSTPVPYGAHP